MRYIIEVSEKTSTINFEEIRTVTLYDMHDFQIDPYNGIVYKVVSRITPHKKNKLTGNYHKIDFYYGHNSRLVDTGCNTEKEALDWLNNNYSYFSKMDYVHFCKLGRK